MSVRNFNNVTTIGTLVAPVASSATSLSVQNFNQAPAVPYTVTLDRNLATEEICLVTAQAGSALTVVRGYDGSAAQSHAAGATIEHTAGAIEYIEANGHVNATVGVHGTTGSLVGDEGAQSLFDKTLIAPLVQADVADGDAVVAYDPTGVRNLFRGMNQSGTDVITIDNTGQVNASALAVAGTSTLSGVLTANGGVTVPAGQTVTASGGVSATSVTAASVTTSGSVTAAGAIVANGGVTVPTGKRVTLTDAPSAGSDAANKTYTDGLFASPPAGRVTPIHWGRGTNFPGSPQPGDSYEHTGLGCIMRHTTPGWRQDTITWITTIADRDAITASYAVWVHPGFRVWVNNSIAEYKWNGSAWVAA